MNRKERNQYVEQHIKDYLPQEYQQSDVKVYEVNKKNGEIKDGLVVREKGEGISPILYLDTYDFSYPEETLQKIAKDYVDILVNNQDMADMIREQLTQREEILNRVTLRPINRERNTVFLADKPYIKLQDLAFYPVIEVNPYMACDITYEFCKSMDLSGKEVLEIATMNLMEQKPVIFSMADMLFKENMISAEEFQKSKAIPMYVISNSQKYFGAAHIMNLDVMESLQNIFQGEFYILPSSVHELIAVDPKKFDQPDAEYEKMVREINRSEVAYEEQLSDHIYRYRSKETGLEMYQEGKWYENSIQIPTPEKIPKQ